MLAAKAQALSMAITTFFGVNKLCKGHSCVNIKNSYYVLISIYA